MNRLKLNYIWYYTTAATEGEKNLVNPPLVGLKKVEYNAKEAKTPVWCTPGPMKDEYHQVKQIAVEQTCTTTALLNP